MTTGDDRYLEHLRGQLTAVLDDVTPPDAPTAAVKRRGKAIRTRRRVGVAAGLAVAVVAAALVPGLLHGPKPPAPANHKEPKVTVRDLGRHAPSGLIGLGSIDGKPWRITLSWQGGLLCVGTSGNLPRAGCGDKYSYALAWPVTLDGSGGSGVNALYGKVARQVQRVSIELSDGAVLNLHPVSFDRQRWIGVELPAKLTVTQAVAYSRSGVLRYAIPFTAARGSLPSFQAWLRPGQPVPPTFTRLIGSGVSGGKRWSVALHSGPWGQCVVPAIPGDSGGGGCWTAASRRPGLVLGTGSLNDGWAVGVTRPGVSYLVFSMTDGSTRHVPVVRVGKVPYYVIVTLHGPAIAHWAAYDASGHRLYGGQGAPGFGHS